MLMNRCLRKKCYLLEYYYQLFDLFSFLLLWFALHLSLENISIAQMKREFLQVYFDEFL